MQPSIWIWIAEAFLGYEWLISGLNKFLNPHFNTQLFSLLQQTAQISSYGWYVAFVRDLVLPNHLLIGTLTEVGETSIGMVLIAAAVISLIRPGGETARYARLASAGALLGSIFLSVNYFFQSGVPLPWLNANDSLAEGVDITILIALLSTALLGANLHVLAERTTVMARVTHLPLPVEEHDVSA